MRGSACPTRVIGHARPARRAAGMGRDGVRSSGVESPDRDWEASLCSVARRASATASRRKPGSGRTEAAGQAGRTKVSTEVKLYRTSDSGQCETNDHSPEPEDFGPCVWLKTSVLDLQSLAGLTDERLWSLGFGL
jgi:hypothetical protein